jgi:hypothetical protein
MALAPLKLDKERNVKKSIGIAVLVSASIVAGAVTAQGMLQDYAADKMVEKFQKATCEELKAQKSKPPSEQEKAAMEFMRNDDQAREIFVKKVAAPIMNKMFECGLIP